MDPKWLRIHRKNTENIENSNQILKIEGLFFNDFLAYGKNAKYTRKTAGKAKNLIQEVRPGGMRGPVGRTPGGV